MYGGMPLYICPGLLLLSRMPMLHMRILMLVQVANASHTNPYAWAGFRQLTRQSLRLCRLLRIHMPILPLVKVPKNAKNSLPLYWIPTIHTPILTLVKVPHNAKHFLHMCIIPTIHMPILMPVQSPNNSHAHPYACAGSQKFTCQSLRL
ncbi:hypothetical protein O181_132650 [Austropuccinia psidii MF-1]|uniref:Secreted protein n=1 Tax=Austropuccinia psidii MF-1 TaxID=1389203 RepID=A0A9Q3L374_9BASI|nr:hypothetical protein [Austropuccinia psidii MF-1]